MDHIGKSWRYCISASKVVCRFLFTDTLKNCKAPKLPSQIFFYREPVKRSGHFLEKHVFSLYDFWFIGNYRKALEIFENPKTLYVLLRLLSRLVLLEKQIPWISFQGSNKLKTLIDQKSRKHDTHKNTKKTSAYFKILQTTFEKQKKHEPNSKHLKQANLVVGSNRKYRNPRKYGISGFQVVCMLIITENGKNGKALKLRSNILLKKRSDIKPAIPGTNVFRFWYFLA